MTVNKRRSWIQRVFLLKQSFLFLLSYCFWSETHKEGFATLREKRRNHKENLPRLFVTPLPRREDNINKKGGHSQGRTKNLYRKPRRAACAENRKRNNPCLLCEDRPVCSFFFSSAHVVPLHLSFRATQTFFFSSPAGPRGKRHSPRRVAKGSLERLRPERPGRRRQAIKDLCFSGALTPKGGKMEALSELSTSLPPPSPLYILNILHEWILDYLKQQIELIIWKILRFLIFNLVLTRSVPLVLPRSDLKGRKPRWFKAPPVSDPYGA